MPGRAYPAPHHTVPPGDARSPPSRTRGDTWNMPAFLHTPLTTSGGGLVLNFQIFFIYVDCIICVQKLNNWPIDMTQAYNVSEPSTRLVHALNGQTVVLVILLLYMDVWNIPLQHALAFCDIDHNRANTYNLLVKLSNHTVENSSHEFEEDNIMFMVTATYQTHPSQRRCRWPRLAGCHQRRRPPRSPCRQHKQMSPSPCRWPDDVVNDDVINVHMLTY